MEKYIIKGGHPLNGEVTISGAKNAAVAIVPATLMVDGPCIIKNVPNIVDVMLQFEILEKMGMKITRLDETTIQTEKGTMDLESPETFELMTRLRASYYFIGAELGRYGHARVAMPGGCNFGGIRPVDQHIKGFERLNSYVRVEPEGFISAIAPEGLVGQPYLFRCCHGWRDHERHAGSCLCKGTDRHGKRGKGAAHRRFGKLPQSDGC